MLAMVQAVDDFCKDALANSVVVIVSEAAEHRAACAAARAQGMKVERIFGTNAPTRIMEQAHAHWYCTLTDFQADHMHTDWRSSGRNGSTIASDADLARSAPQTTMRMLHSFCSSACTLMLLAAHKCAR